jgi:hypothetical protein
LGRGNGCFLELIDLIVDHVGGLAGLRVTSEDKPGLSHR